MTRPCAMFVLCLATLIAAVGKPTDTSADRKMLRGLQGVSVLLEALHPDVERLAFSAQQLQADIELRLRRAGVPIPLTGTEPILHVVLSVESVPEIRGFYVYALDISVLQSAVLERDPTLLAISAPTWEVNSLGIVGRDRLKDLRPRVLDRVDQFVNAYYAANPERTPVQGPKPGPAPAPRKEKRR
jgi:hypothetical protein